jgi:hypothetical protein
VREVQRKQRSRLQLLFLVALLGVLLILGIGVAELAGTWAGVAYAVVVLGLVAVGAARARAAQQRAQEPVPGTAGRTCTCCTTTQHDPVQVI